MRQSDRVLELQSAQLMKTVDIQCPEMSASPVIDVVLICAVLPPVAHIPS